MSPSLISEMTWNSMVNFVESAMLGLSALMRWIVMTVEIDKGWI